MLFYRLKQKANNCWNIKERRLWLDVVRDGTAIIDRCFHRSRAGEFSTRGSSPWRRQNNGTEKLWCTFWPNPFFGTQAHIVAQFSHGIVQCFIDFKTAQRMAQRRWRKKDKSGNDISAIYDVKFEAQSSWRYAIMFADCRKGFDTRWYNFFLASDEKLLDIIVKLSRRLVFRMIWFLSLSLEQSFTEL